MLRKFEKKAGALIIFNLIKDVRKIYEPAQVDYTSFPSKLYADENNEVLVYVKELLKIKHYASAIQKWKILDSSRDIIRKSNQSIVVWEKFDKYRGFDEYSSIVQEGSIDYNFKE